MTGLRTLRVPCFDAQAAADCAAHLRGQGVDVAGVDDRFVLVPAGWSALFVWDLAEAVADWCIDEELARWARRQADIAVGAAGV
jgi:hypothetical protein